jgi:hypothetical protein
LLSATESPQRGSEASARSNGTPCPLDIYLPPAECRANLPIVYALDGEWRFAERVNIAEATHARFIIVAFGNQANRSVDYVPVNTCTPSGGGHVATGFHSFGTDPIHRDVDRR